MVVDFLMLHEGPLQDMEMPPTVRASNVRFIDVGTGGIASLIARGMGEKLHLDSSNITVLTTRMRFMFSKWPRLVAEYKPAFGTVFSEYLANYTHWGYSDLDIVVGHVVRFLERSELIEHHIVTYSFGDTEAVYLRGQWTVHQNLPNVNSIWLGCEHLGRGLQQEISQKVAWVRKNEAAGRVSYHKRFLSAEGCYSYRAFHTKGIKVKVARKQFAGLELREHAREVVYAIRGALWVCQQDGSAGGSPFQEPNLTALGTLSDLQCDQSLPGVQTALGEPVRVETSGEGCGSWMPSEFRVCASALKDSRQQTVLRRNGAFYSQAFEEAPSVSAERGRCRQVAFFHMQEWKKRWQDGQSHVDPRAAFDTFRLSQDGIERLDLV
mmetsp:Transcript_58410/g.115963  ORF Transcript_58410/g.115963 Transcript_58410/m.115963 type:complete len:380 (-) Transcript_58410:275-1414(-)|eukprot:CAMPEP_0174701970 /NCGR_PEP_ID=MMETSP1094-20130205/6418_1 /TAXON_ID=156173 /ORGANISM="Chrysochromulina brevifilum, Strain UTEX LB 985" /LENGTH=379 /DNA_ID=CAMNT_0015899681 /DNA_START=108 /DNA_END=1247 /DNA_ORIENTATION=+